MTPTTAIAATVLSLAAAGYGLIEGRRAKEGAAYTLLMTVAYGGGAVLGMLLATLLGEVLGLV